MFLFENELYSLWRGNAREISVAGELVVVEGDEVVYQSLDCLGRYPARSVLKPFQFLAGGLPVELWRGKAEFAAACGSLMATAEQVETFRKWEAESPRQQILRQLKLPAIFPEDGGLRAKLRGQRSAAEQRYHNCYGKHQAILLACMHHGWPLESYLEQQHPFHQSLCATLSRFTGRSDFEWVVDGCQLPSPVLELSEIARLYQALAAAPSDTTLGQIGELMLRHPLWVGGPGSVDSDWMLTHPNKVVAKRGADGLMGIGLLPCERFPRGAGIALKLYGGFTHQSVALALAPLLKDCGYPITAIVPKGQTVNYHYEPFQSPLRRAIDITPVLQPKLGLFDGEVPFTREVALDVERGDVITLSSIRTTCHAGAHADAPNHFAKGEIGIDEVDVSRYVGLVQVIHVPKPRGGLVTLAEVKEKVRSSRRLIFRTDSHPDPTQFSPGFAALDPALITWLAGRGVVLVGIDTPSIDPATAKNLAAHQATLANRMAILENLQMSQVPPGDYYLIAVPLRLAGADASPVRAVLYK